MFGWLFRYRDEAYREALASQRAVIATLTERNEKLAEDNGKLRATVDMQFRDLREMAKSQAPPPAPSSPLLDALKPKEPSSQPPRPNAFRNMATSDGRIRPQAVKAVKDKEAQKA